MIRKIALIASFVIVSTAAFGQDSRPKSYDPNKGVPAAAVAVPVRPADAKAQAGAAQVNREAAIEKAKADAMRKAEQDAQAAFAKWKTAKQECLAQAGLSYENGDYIFDPARPLVIRVRDNVWLQPEVFNLSKLRSCR